MSNRTFTSAKLGAADFGRCTVQMKSGRFCDIESMPEAPYPICPKHAAKLFLFLRSRMSVDDASRVEATLDAMARDRGARLNRRRYRETHDEVVYYVRVGEYIKIGFTGNLRERMKAYMTGTLLACEPGGRSTERLRLQQFQSHRAPHGQEWFLPSAALAAHIEEVRATHPQPDISRRRPVGVELRKSGAPDRRIAG